MRFAFTQDQQLFRQTVRTRLARICPAAEVRAAWQTGIARARWRELAELGVIGLLAPEAHGGSGLTELELVVALEELGRAALPEPVVETAAVAVPLLAASPLAARWLPAITAGERVVTVGLAGAPLLPHAAAADLLLLEHGGDLYALAADSVTSTPAASVDGARQLARVTWRPEHGERIGRAESALDRGALGTAAVLLGLARQLLDITVEYAKVRHQFGRPIGSFQAVKHHLANALGRIEFAAPLVHRAAYAMAHREGAAAVRISMAKACASDAAAFVAKTALQCHGAIGYAFEHDLHLWMKRVWALAAAWGDAAWHRNRVAEAVLDGRLELELGDG